MELVRSQLEPGIFKEYSSTIFLAHKYKYKYTNSKYTIGWGKFIRNLSRCYSTPLCMQGLFLNLKILWLILFFIFLSGPSPSWRCRWRTARTPWAQVGRGTGWGKGRKEKPLSRFDHSKNINKPVNLANQVNLAKLDISHRLVIVILATIVFLKLYCSSVDNGLFNCWIVVRNSKESRQPLILGKPASEDNWQTAEIHCVHCPSIDPPIQKYPQYHVSRAVGVGTNCRISHPVLGFLLWV